MDAQAEETPQAPAPPRRRNARLIAAGLLAPILIALGALAALLAFRPDWPIRHALRWSCAPLPAGLEGARWISPGELELRGITLGDAGHIDSVRVRFSLRDLARLRIADIEVSRPSFNVTRDAILQQQKKVATPAASSPLPLQIGRLAVRDGLIRVDNLGPGIPSLLIPLDTGVSNIVFGCPPDHPTATQPITIEMGEFVLRSPYDPLASVLRLKGLTVELTPRGFLERRLERVEFVEPTLFVGQDLFWFSDFLQKETAGMPPGEPWTVGRFRVTGGRMVVATQGQPDLPLPFVLRATQDEMKLAGIQDLHINLVAEILPISLDYTDRYGIAVENLSGRVEFALPHTSTNANNVVNTLNADCIRWTSLASMSNWVSLTYDVNGIYGRFGGASCGGYVNGDVTLLFAAARDWVASVSGTAIDLGEPVRLKAPDQIRLTGRGSGSVVVRGSERVIRECTGDFKLLDRGVLEILAMEDLLDRVPADWDATRKDLVGIALNAFRTYHYTSGEAAFSYKPPRSTLGAHFLGAEGKRNFEVNYSHDEDKPLAIP